MKKLAFVVAILAVFMTASVLWAEAPLSPVGNWKTIDDNTGKAMYLINIFEKNGKMYGKIADVLNPADKNKVCDKCEGADKGKPIQGMMVIKDMKVSGDEYAGGTIMDVASGKVYKGKLKVVEGGKKLKASGCILFLCRAQTWLKAD